MEGITNHHWLSCQIQGAVTQEELDQCLVDIGCDMFEGEPWTKDPALVAELRREHAWKQRLIRRSAGRGV